MKKIINSVDYRRANKFKSLMAFMVFFALSINNFALNSIKNAAVAESFGAAQNTIARMFNAVNFPFKMVEGHFKNTGTQKSKQEKTKTDAAEASQFSLVPTAFNLKAPLKQAESARAAAPSVVYSLSANNLNFVDNAVHRRLSMEFMMCIILLLCLSVLPRGISPDNIIKNKKNSMPLTAVFLTKHSFFLFLSGIKTGVV